VSQTKKRSVILPLHNILQLKVPVIEQEYEVVYETHQEVAEVRDSISLFIQFNQVLLLYFNVLSFAVILRNKTRMLFSENYISRGVAKGNVYWS